MSTLELAIFLTCAFGSMSVLHHYVEKGKISVWYKVPASIIVIGLYIYLNYVVPGRPFP